MEGRTEHGCQEDSALDILRLGEACRQYLDDCLA